MQTTQRQLQFAPAHLLAKGLAVAAFQTLLRWQERATERHFLAGLDDHALKDVGLNRADIEQEASKPFWRR